MTVAACRSTSTRRKSCSGVELILTSLHAGGKFSDKNYRFSGGLHGVGVSVVNALSKNLEVLDAARRQGIQHELPERQGNARSSKWSATSARNNTGTTVRFWPDPQYFDSVAFSVPRLKHLLRAKAVLCPGSRVTLKVEKSGEKDEWLYTGGVEQYLVEALGREDGCPPRPSRAASKASARRPSGRWHGESTASRRRRELRQLIPTTRAARTSTVCAPGSPMRCASSASSAISCRGA